MLGYSADERIGTNIMDVIYEDDRALVMDRARRRALGEDVPSGYEVRIVRKDGSLLPILIYGSNVDYLGEKAIQGVFIDISERKQVERELEQTLERLGQSEKRHRLLVDSSHDGIVVIRDSKMTFFNRKMMQLVGYEESDLIDRPFMDVTHPDDRRFVMDNYLRRIGGEYSPDRYEFRLVNKEGNSGFCRD